MKSIPVVIVIDGVENLLPSVDEAEAERLVATRNFRPVRNRRGHIRRLYVAKRLTGLIHLERDGYCFQQHISTGRVYALVGVRGSEN